MASIFDPPWMKRHEAEEEARAEEEVEPREGLLQRFLKRQADHDKLMEGREAFQAYDPSLPADRIYNQPPRYEVPGWQLSMQFELRVGGVTPKQYDEVLPLIKAGRFRTRRELAEHFDRSREWAGTIVRVAVKWNDISKDEIKRLLPGKKGRKYKQTV